MPTSGLPTNWALLKMTKGSSGPARNPFQKIGNVGETDSAASATADVFTGLRLISKVTITASEAASRIAKVAAETTNFRGRTRDPETGSGLISAIAS